MLILSLDTTTRGGSVALIREGRVVYLRGGDAARTHAERLPTDLMLACDAGGVGIRDIELFAVAAGPGSFTGLRIGIATMQGLAMARDRRIVPVSTLEAVAAAAEGGPGAPGRRRGRTAAWIDAQRGEVFAQIFEGTSPISDAVSATPLVALETHAAMLGDAEFHGDGAVRYRQQILTALGPAVQIADQVPPLAGPIGLIAAAWPDRAVLPHAVAPIYVRRPDAELARDKREPDR